VTEAEQALRAGAAAAAETLYRSAIAEGRRLLDPGADRRAAVAAQVAAALAQAYLNLGVMKARANRFDEAAELLTEAAAFAPDSVPIQHALGVARFNARRFDGAVEPLSRAAAADPGNADLARMLALACFQAQAYGRAAELLAKDPARAADPALQYAYGVSLVRSGRAGEAEAAFGRLLAEHGGDAEIRVVLGEAHAQQGDYPAAIAALQEALRLAPQVAGAQGSLGVIYLRQGRLAEAEEALRAELRAHPDDLQSTQNLAIVLDLAGRAREARPLLQQVVAARPASADARYLLGKVLLAEGAAADAAGQLEQAARLAPEEARIRYQLAQAYQRLGRGEEAEREYAVFRELKDRRRSTAVR
jgi:Flp pilus assembly protein TadD